MKHRAHFIHGNHFTPSFSPSLRARENAGSSVVSTSSGNHHEIQIKSSPSREKRRRFSRGHLSIIHSPVRRFTRVNTDLHAFATRVYAPCPSPLSPSRRVASRRPEPFVRPPRGSSRPRQRSPEERNETNARVPFRSVPSTTLDSHTHKRAHAFVSNRIERPLDSTRRTRPAPHTVARAFIQSERRRFKKRVWPGDDARHVGFSDREPTTFLRITTHRSVSPSVETLEIPYPIRRTNQ